MTKYKQYVRKNHGIKLDIDYDYLPYKGLECTTVCITSTGEIRVTRYFDTIVINIDIDRYGNKRFWVR